MSSDIVVINPNTTQNMTNGLIELISHLTTTPPKYFTSPSGVTSINNEADAAISAKACLPSLTSDYIPTASGFLVACYSEHPLVGQLKALTTSPVVGIFEASVSTSLLLIAPHQKFGIVSTGKVWEELLDTAVVHYLGARGSERYAGTETTGLNATDLHDAPAAVVRQKMMEATKRLVERGDVGAICLGCAGMIGMDEMVRKACVEELGKVEGDKIHIIDGVKSGYTILEGLVRGNAAV